MTPVFDRLIAFADNYVDDDPNRTCSAGLHICTWQYLPSFGSARSEDDRVMIVAIDPKERQ